MPGWRNWQTHGTQNPAVAIPCRFDSDPRHQNEHETMLNDCIFCKIVAHEAPAEIVAENEDILVIKDLYPKLPIHLLIIPKVHYKDITHLADWTVGARMLQMADKLSREIEGAQEFRLIINNGYEVGQRVFHLHMHFLAGANVPEF